MCSNVDDVNNRTLYLTAKLLKQGNKYHTFEKHFLNSTTDTLSELLNTILGLSPQVKYFTMRSKAVLLLWIIYVISVLFCYAVMHVCLSMPCCHLLERAGLFALVCDV